MKVILEKLTEEEFRKSSLWDTEIFKYWLWSNNLFYGSVKEFHYSSVAQDYLISLEDSGISSPNIERLEKFFESQNLKFVLLDQYYKSRDKGWSTSIDSTDYDAKCYTRFLLKFK